MRLPAFDALDERLGFGHRCPRSLQEAASTVPHACEHEPERARHPLQLERLHEEAGVADFSATAAAQEAAQLLLDRSPSPFDLLLERAERAQIPVLGGNILDPVGAEPPDKLVLEVANADVEAEPFHVVSREIRAEAGVLEAAPELTFLAGVAKAGEPDVKAARAVEVQVAPNRLGTADRHDGDALGLEVVSVPFSKGLERDPVADPLDQHDAGERVPFARLCSGSVHATLT